MRRALLPPTLILGLMVSAILSGCGGPPESGAIAPSADPQALEGGDPLPGGPLGIRFPWIGKQSILCVGNAVERQVAFVDFSDEVTRNVGRVDVAADGHASGAFTIAASMLRTGHAKRDAKLLNHNWLDAETHPTLVLACERMTRVHPAVWRIEGAWTMRGVTRPVTFLANVRYVGAMRNVGERVVRVKASFPIRLRDFEIVNPSVGTPAVSETWNVDVVLLGVIED